MHVEHWIQIPNGLLFEYGSAHTKQQVSSLFLLSASQFFMHCLLFFETVLSPWFSFNFFMPGAIFQVSSFCFVVSLIYSLQAYLLRLQMTSSSDVYEALWMHTLGKCITVSGSIASVLWLVFDGGEYIIG